MSEILLIRHGESAANVGQRTALDQKRAPLTPLGRQQSRELNSELKTRFGITPETYNKPVASSTFVRPMQTALVAGFCSIDFLPLIDESDVAHQVAGGLNAIAKHRDERWAPEETKLRVSEFHDKLVASELDYEIYFGHGLFWGEFLYQCDERGIHTSATFCERRGYVPLQGAVIRVHIPEVA